MANQREKKQALFADESGQAMVEYAIIVWVIAIMLSIFYLTFTAAIDNHFSYISRVWMAPVP
ncbi:MAG: hypothetical protein HY720_18385 [Planctomycetes bacterium]|nr:hypothetical protein [Planctomycetota bacterium]